MKVYMGIDPGASGGLAWVDGTDDVDGERDAEAVKMYRTEKDVFNWLAMSDASHFAVIEKVGGYIGIPQPGSAMFKFGMSYGGLRMALIALAIPFDEVTPQKWQKAMGIAPRKKNESKTAFKNRLKQKAEQFFPSLTVTLATADALLIAEYCRRRQEGCL